MMLLADECVASAIIDRLRSDGHTLVAIRESSPSSTDPQVVSEADQMQAVLLTEDKDFGLLAYAGGHQTAGVLLIRFPSDARNSLGEAVARVVAELGERMKGAFVVIEPGRARVSRPPAMG